MIVHLVRMAISIGLFSAGFFPSLTLAALDSHGPSIVASQASEEHDLVVRGGAWRYRSVPCVDGSVQQVSPRLGDARTQNFTHRDYELSGVAVSIRLARPTAFVLNVSRTHAGVTHYQGEADNDLMEAERPGDRVQVCLLSFPTPRANERCNPDKDPRGWEFRVYDYRQHAAYFGSETEHYCGGA